MNTANGRVRRSPPSWPARVCARLHSAGRDVRPGQAFATHASADVVRQRFDTRGGLPVLGILPAHGVFPPTSVSAGEKVICAKGLRKGPKFRPKISIGAHHVFVMRKPFVQ